MNWKNEEDKMKKGECVYVIRFFYVKLRMVFNRIGKVIINNYILNKWNLKVKL